MPVTLTIENETSLPDGGPLSYTITGKRGIDIGRDSYLDWALPDPTRTVSGKHCEVRYRDGGYWLHDVSRNGTFLNRNTARMQVPHLLRDGDRIEVGRYIIAVRVEGEEGNGSGMVSAPTSPSQYWDAAGEAAPPISPRDLRPPRELQPVQADFRDWAIDVPAATHGQPGYDAFPAPPPARQPADDMGWAQGVAARAPAAPPVPPVPTPRRPSAPAGGNPWDSAPAADPAGWAAPPPPPPVAESWTPPPAPPGGDAWGAPPSPPSAANPGWASPPQPAQAAPPPAAESPWGMPTLSPAPAAAPPAPAPQPAVPQAAAPPPGQASAAPTSFAPEFAPPPPPPMAVPQPAAPQPAPAAPAQRGGGPDEFVRRFAKGAGISPDIVAWRDAGDLAEDLGSLMRLSADSVKQLLSARTEAKRVARTGSHTMIQALDNNPLKFSPTPEDALKIMLGKPSSGYLDARRAFEQSFKDLKTHQVKTYAAMQNALRLLMEDLDPDTIESSQEGGGGLGALLSSKKAKLWDLYVTRWDTLTSPHEDGMVDAFMMFFAECYDK